MLCSVCKRNRDNVTPKSSDLMPSIRLFLCGECLEAGKEPRYIIVLVARGGESTSVKPYIKDHRYVGDPITAKEMMV